MNALDLQHRIRELVEPSLERLGYELVAVEWLGGTQGRILRLSIEAPGSGISADDCARVSDAISPLLDEEDPVDGRYVLEVSSPGIDRPVQRPEDFERFAGYRIKLRLVEGHPRRRYAGELRGFEEGDVIVRVDGVDHRIALESVQRANLVLDLEEYQNLAEARHDDQ